MLVAVAPFWMVGIDALFGDGAVASLPDSVVGLAVGFAGVVLLDLLRTRQ